VTLECFRSYLIGVEFIVETDHQSLQWIQQSKAPMRQARWALRLAEFNLTIRHRKGRHNDNADALWRLEQTSPDAESRLDQVLVSPYLVALENRGIGSESFSVAQRSDPGVRAILEQCTGSDSTTSDEYELHSEL
jgi:hypothetical protein